MPPVCRTHFHALLLTDAIIVKLESSWWQLHYMKCSFLIMILEEDMLWKLLAWLVKTCKMWILVSWATYFWKKYSTFSVGLSLDFYFLLKTNCHNWNVWIIFLDISSLVLYLFCSRTRKYFIFINMKFILKWSFILSSWKKTFFFLTSNLYFDFVLKRQCSHL